MVAAKREVTEVHNHYSEGIVSVPSVWHPPSPTEPWTITFTT